MIVDSAEVSFSTICCMRSATFLLGVAVAEATSASSAVENTIFAATIVWLVVVYSGG